MNNLSDIISLAIHTFISWVAASTYMFYFYNRLEKTRFVVGFYIVTIFVNVLIYYLFFKVSNRELTPFATTSISMIIYFAIYFVIYKWFYRGELWFLNYTDFIIPVFIMTSVIYFLGVFIKT